MTGKVHKIEIKVAINYDKQKLEKKVVIRTNKPDNFVLRAETLAKAVEYIENEMEEK